MASALGPTMSTSAEGLNLWSSNITGLRARDVRPDYREIKS